MHQSKESAWSRLMLPVDMITIDLDGTLIDSAGDLFYAAKIMQRELQLTAASESDVRNWIGNGIERFVHRVLTKSMQNDAESELFGAAFDCFCSAYHQCNGHYSSVYPDVSEALQWINAQRVPMICVTNKARRYSEPLLRHHNILQYFDCLIAGDDVKSKKPHPEALLKAAEKIGCKPSRCVMIGDSISDIRAARSARFVSICVTYGYNHGIDIRAMPASQSADLVVDSFAELKEELPRIVLP